MPAFDASTPTASRTIGGTVLAVPMPFTAGHALTAPEAAFLNSQIVAVVSNATTGDLRRALDAYNTAHAKDKGFTPVTTPEAISFDVAAKFGEKYAAYTLGESNRGKGDGTSTDPAAKLAHVLNKADCEARIIAKGYKVRDFQTTKNADGVSRFTEFLEKNWKDKGDEFMARATAELASNASTDAGTDSLLDSIVSAPVAEEVPAAA